MVYSAADRRSVAKVTHVSQQEAVALLTVAKGNPQNAINYFYDHGIDAKVKAHLPKVVEKDLWDTYKNPEKGCMEQTEISKFWEDLAVDPYGVMPIILSYFASPASPGFFKEAEFRLMCDKVGASGMVGFKSHLANLEKMYLSQDDKIKEIWAFAWKNLTSSPGIPDCPPKEYFVYYMKLFLPKYGYTTDFEEFMT